LDIKKDEKWYLKKIKSRLKLSVRIDRPTTPEKVQSTREGAGSGQECRLKGRG
jgi:hypothetical protein